MRLKDSKDELADAELDRIGSDIEEGGLDLSLSFQPITAYVSDKREMLKQCFHVLGEKKLQKMLPDELKVILSTWTLCFMILIPAFYYNYMTASIHVSVIVVFSKMKVYHSQSHGSFHHNYGK